MNISIFVQKFVTEQSTKHVLAYNLPETEKALNNFLLQNSYHK